METRRDPVRPTGGAAVAQVLLCVLGVGVSLVVPLYGLIVGGAAAGYAWSRRWRWVAASVAAGMTVGIVLLILSWPAHSVLNAGT